MQRSTFSVVLPYYNERDFIRPTLESCIAQQRLPDQLILVDNASTDGSEQICRGVLRDSPPAMRIDYLHEKKPGFLSALVCGISKADCEFVAVWNADTVYPPHYFALCESIVASSPQDVVALMARDIYAPPSDWSSRWARYFYHTLAVLRPRMAFTGSYGQVLRAAALRDCGGYSAELWPYTMEDHELIHRLCKLGYTRTHPDLWCLASNRRKDRSGVHWTLTERLLYFATPYALGDRYFYQFLAPRFARRRMLQVNLRSKDWAASPASSHTPHTSIPQPSSDREDASTTS